MPKGSTIVGGSNWSDFSDIKLDLKFPEPKAVTVEPRKTLLQIVDMQEFFVGREKTGPKYISTRETVWQGEKFISNIKALLEKARELEMDVVYQYSTSIRNPYEKTRKLFSVDPPWGPIIEEIQPIDRFKEYIVSKTGHDIFFHTHLDDLLEKELPHIDTVIVTGVVTYVCVLYTVGGYCTRGYNVIVPMDGCLCPELENQAMTLHVMAIRSPNFPVTITLSNMITFASDS